MLTSTNPFDPDDLVVQVPTTSPDAVRVAFDQARAAQQEWSRGPASARAEALCSVGARIAEHADELAELVVREVGKPATEAAAEVSRAVAIVKYYAQQVFDPIGSLHEPSLAGGLLMTQRRPLGVAGLVTPWNFPLAIPLWKAAPALAFGNAVMLKPAPEATACALRLHELLREVLPDGLFQVMPGGAETGQAVIEGADVVSFTGSTDVGRRVAQLATNAGIPAQAEMGGQNPSIVLADAEMERSAGQIAVAAMGYAGQKCTATKRVVVVGDPSTFRDALVAAVESLAVGDPRDRGTVIGPVISERARARVLDATEHARRTGGRVLTGGTAPAAPGWFVAPTVVEGLAADSPLARDEVFGPICLLQTAVSVEEAVGLANGVEQGLAAAVYTRDLASALRVSAELDAGMIKVNAPTSGVDYHVPFGGEKASSLGAREQGKAAQDFYTSVHTVTIAS